MWDFCCVWLCGSGARSIGGFVRVVRDANALHSTMEDSFFCCAGQAAGFTDSVCPFRLMEKVRHVALLALKSSLLLRASILFSLSLLVCQAR